MKNSKQILAILAVLAAAAAGPAAAQDRGAYLGGSVGLAQYKDTCDNFPAAASCDDQDAAWRVFAGYSFSRNAALELGFVDLGNASATSGGVVSDADTRGVDLVAVLGGRVAGGLSLFGKLGIYRTKTTVETAGARRGETDSGFTYGLGLGYDLWKLGIRLEWQRYDNIGAIGGEDAADVFSVGALIRF